MDKATPDYLRGEKSEEGGNTERRWIKAATPNYLRGKTRRRQYREEVA